MIKFEPSGNSKSFYEAGYLATIDAAAWVKDKGLNAFEYSFGRGITINNTTAVEIGTAFKKENIELSIHAPYFINFGNPDPLMIEKSYGYITGSLHKLKHFGGDRLVVHVGSYGKRERSECMANVKANIKQLKEILALSNHNEKICFETMGKESQIGSLEDIISLCKISENFYPCLDMGHINCRSRGGLKTKEDYETIIKTLFDNMEREKVVNMHVHFSKIEYGPKGEVRHLTFEDNIYGPNFEPFAEIIAKYNLEPHIICESDGTQAEDAEFMKNYYNSII